MKKRSISGAQSTKLAKEKFDILCNNSKDKLEIEKNLWTDFNDFILRVHLLSEKNDFASMNDKTVCEICSIQVNMALLY